MYRTYDGHYIDYDDPELIDEEEYEKWLKEMDAQHLLCSNCGKVGEYPWDHAEDCPHYQEPPLPF